MLPRPIASTAAPAGRALPSRLLRGAVLTAAAVLAAAQAHGQPPAAA